MAISGKLARHLNSCLCSLLSKLPKFLNNMSHFMNCSIFITMNNLTGVNFINV